MTTDYSHILSLLADPQGHEVAWDYCLEHGIIMHDDSCNISEINCTGHSGRNRSQFTMREVGVTVGLSYSGRHGSTISEAPSQSMSGFIGYRRALHLLWP